AHGFIGFAGIARRAIDEMQQHAAAFDVAEDAVAEAGALVRSFNQARNIGEHELAAIDTDDAKLRIERGERIVGDFGFGGADGGEEGRFAGIRKADDAGVRDQLEAQPDGLFRARLTRIGAPRRPIGRGLEMRVAEATIAAAQQHYLLRGFGEIGDQRRTVLLIDLRADRHFEQGVRAVGAMTILAHASLAVLGVEVLLVAIVDQRIESLDGQHNHVATLAAIAAVRAAIFNEFLAAERHAAVSTVARADINL